MPGASSLEELKVWMKARTLVKRIYEITTASQIKHDFGFCNQIRRAAVSIMSNIAEGFGRSSDKEFARYLDIARGSSFETQSLIHVANDVGYIDEAVSTELLKVTFEVIAMITSLGGYLRDDPTRHMVTEPSLQSSELTQGAPNNESDFGLLTSDSSPIEHRIEEKPQTPPRTPAASTG